MRLVSEEEYVIYSKSAIPTTFELSSQRVAFRRGRDRRRIPRFRQRRLEIVVIHRR